MSRPLMALLLELLGVHFDLSCFSCGPRTSKGGGSLTRRTREGQVLPVIDGLRCREQSPGLPLPA